MVYQSSSRPLLALHKNMNPRAFLPRTGLPTLPVELICLIFDHLPMHDLLACMLVSRHLRKVVNESSRLQYIIELARHKMVSLLPANAAPSFATRLKLLRDRETAWKHIDFKKRHELKLPPTGSVYEFVGGIYGNGREDDSRATASISFLELPSTDAALLGEPPRELQMWTHTHGDVTIIDFTMDPSQDLLVLVALAPPDSKCVYELHLRSIKTNLPHTKAPVAILPCLNQPAVQPQPSEIVAAVRVQVLGNLVALLIKEVFESTGAHLQIWNWENGVRHSSSMNRISGIDDFTFLTHESFLLVRPTGRFEVYNFVDPLHRDTVPILRSSFAFPALSDGYMYWYIAMSSNPAPGYVPTANSNFDDASTNNCRQIYYPRPDERVHACCLYIFNPTNEDNPVVHSFVFFLNLKTLLNPPQHWFQSPSRAVSRKVEHIATPQSARSSSPWAVSNSSPTEVPIHGPSSSPTSVLYHGPSSSSSSHSLGLLAETSSSSILSEGWQSSSEIYALAQASPETQTSEAGTVPLASPEQDASSSGYAHSMWSSSSTAGATEGSSSSAPTSSAAVPASVSANDTSATRRHVGGTSSSAASSSTLVPWEVWGPKSTRWFEECLSTDWQHAIYGLRTVESVHPTRHPHGFPPGFVVVDQGSATTSGSATSTVAGTSGGAATASTSTPATQSSSITTTSGPANPPQPTLLPIHVPIANSQGTNNDLNAIDEEPTPASERRHLRIRDFNPYSFRDAELAACAPNGSRYRSSPRASSSTSSHGFPRGQGVIGSSGLNSSSSSGSDTKTCTPTVIASSPSSSAAYKGKGRIVEASEEPGLGPQMDSGKGKSRADGRFAGCREGEDGEGCPSAAASSGWTTSAAGGKVPHEPHFSSYPLLGPSGPASSSGSGSRMRASAGSGSSSTNGGTGASDRVGGRTRGHHGVTFSKPRLVTEPSTTSVKGVFKHDIISELPYTEVISEETFEVTDVMMDDCRLLLLKRGKAGKLKRVEVLMM